MNGAIVGSNDAAGHNRAALKGISGASLQASKPVTLVANARAGVSKLLKARPGKLLDLLRVKIEWMD